MARNRRETYGSRSSGRSRIGIALDLVMFLLTVLAAVLLICAYCSKYINPNTFWAFAFFGLSAPFLYIANIMLLLYWVIRWRYWAFIPLGVLLIGISSVSLFFRPSLSKNYTHENNLRTVVMTYNVMGFIFDDDSGQTGSSIDSIAALVERVNPDILCFQEFQAVSAEQKEHIDSVMNMPYNAVNYKISNSSGGGWGLAIYSRFPILSFEEINFESSTNSALWADLKAGPDTLRVFNCHLQTTSVNSTDRDYINNHEFLLPGPEREERVRNIFSKLRNNFRKRAEQVDSLAPMIHNTPHPVLVCGDFNDTPLSYTYHKMRGKLSDAFVEKGRGMPNTYKGLFNMFRIDYILHSKELEVLNYHTPADNFSDHKPVVAGFDFP